MSSHSIFVTALFLLAATIASGQVSTLTDCLLAASAFRSTCNTSAPAPDFVEHIPAVQVRSFDAKSCPISSPNPKDTTVSGDACVWKRRLCVTCSVSNATGRVQIRVQSNGLPDHGYWSEATNPVEMNIDFTVDFDPPLVTNTNAIPSESAALFAESVLPPRTPQLNVTSSAGLNAVLCSANSSIGDAEVPMDSHFSTVNSKSTNIISGVAISGMPMGSVLSSRQAPSGTSDVQDSLFPVDGSNVAEFDTCLLHGNHDYTSKGASPLFYTSPSPCIVGDRRHRHFQKICGVSNQCKGIIGEIETSFASLGVESNQTIIGIAKDGHLVYGPTMNLTSKTAVSGGTDICNGVFFDGHQGDGVLRSYAYQATAHFPYLVGCFGPSTYPNAHDVRPACTTNPPSSYESWAHKYHIPPEIPPPSVVENDPLPPLVTLIVDESSDSDPRKACKDLAAMKYFNGVTVLNAQINYPHIDSDIFFPKTYFTSPILLSIEVQHNAGLPSISHGLNVTQFAVAVYALTRQKMTVRVISVNGASAPRRSFQIAWSIAISTSGKCTLRGGLEHARLGSLRASQDLMLQINIPKVIVENLALEAHTRAGDEFANSVTITAGPHYGKLLPRITLNSSMNHSVIMPEITGNGFRDSLIVVMSGVCNMSHVALRGGNGGRGAAVRLEPEAILHLDTVLLRENNAPSSGGGIYVSNHAVATVSNSLFYNNIASINHVGLASGGALFNQGNVIIHGSTFESNTALSTVSQAAGGAIYNIGYFKAEHSVFVKNNAAGGTVGEGGGLATFRNGSAMEMFQCTISNNTASISGGALFVQGALTMRHCEVEFNEAVIGSAIRTTPDSPEPLLINVSMTDRPSLSENSQVDGVQEFILPDNFRNGPW